MRRFLNSTLLVLVTIVCLPLSFFAQTNPQYFSKEKVNVQAKIDKSIEINSTVNKLSPKELATKPFNVNFNNRNNNALPIANSSSSSLATQIFNNTSSATLNGTNCGPLNQCNNSNCAASSVTVDEFPIVVSGISCSTGLVSNGVITQVCIDISGTVGQSLMDVTTIYLASPNGLTMELLKGTCAGGAGLGIGCVLTDYVGPLCFQTGATAQPVTSAGTYAPEQPFSTLNNSNLNGTWELIVVGQECPTGLPPATFNSWSITFETADIYPPLAKCNNLTVYLNALGQGGFNSIDIDNGSADDCAGANSNNVATCDSRVTVIDTIKPNAICQNITVYIDGTGNTSITAVDIDNGSSDMCGIKSMALSNTSFDCSNLGENNVTITVTDNNDNVSTCTAAVLVLDTIPPTAVCQNITAYLDGTGNTSITAADIDNGSTDNCGIMSLELSKESFDCSNLGLNEVYLWISDQSGNLDSCLAKVTIENTPLTVICKDTTLALNAGGIAILRPEDVW